MATREGKNAMKKRKTNSESIFAEAKMNHGLLKFNCRRLSNVRKVSYLIASVLNIKRLLTELRKPGRITGSAGFVDYKNLKTSNDFFALCY